MQRLGGHKRCWGSLFAICAGILVFTNRPQTAAGDEKPAVDVGHSRLLPTGSVSSIQQTSAASSPEDAKKRHAELHSRVKVLKEGSSEKKDRQKAERLLMVSKMSAEDRRKVHAIVNDTSFFRQLPTLQFEVDPRSYLFFAEQPDVTVSLWRAMGISKFKVLQTGKSTYTADGGDGTKGSINVVRNGALQKIILCEGVFKSPLLLTGIRTRSILHLQTNFVRGKDGKTYALHRAFVHVSFPSTTVEAAAKLLTPVGNTILDRNFREISLFLHVMSLAMTKQPGWIEHLAKKMDGITDQQKKDLVKITARVFSAKRKQEEIPLLKTRREYIDDVSRPTQTANRSDKRMTSR